MRDAHREGKRAAGRGGSPPLSGPRVWQITVALFVMLAVTPAHASGSGGKAGAETKTPANEKNVGQAPLAKPAAPLPRGGPATTTGRKSVTDSKRGAPKQLDPPARIDFDRLAAGQSQSFYYNIAESDLTVTLHRSGGGAVTGDLVIVSGNKPFCQHQAVTRPCDFHAPVGVYQMSVQNIGVANGFFYLVFTLQQPEDSQKVRPQKNAPANALLNHSPAAAHK
jgi:hypothetical protein